MGGQRLVLQPKRLLMARLESYRNAYSLLCQHTPWQMVLSAASRPKDPLKDSFSDPQKGRPPERLVFGPPKGFTLGYFFAVCGGLPRLRIAQKTSFRLSETQKTAHLIALFYTKVKKHTLHGA